MIRLTFPAVPAALIGLFAIAFVSLRADAACYLTQTYPPQTICTEDVSTAGQVAHWNFDESSGVAVDMTGNGNNGTFMNGATRFVGTQNENKLLTDGIDDYLLVQDADSLDIGTGNFSIAGWFRLEIPQGQSGPLVIKQAEGATSGYALFVDLDRKFVLQGRDTDASVRYAETGSTVMQPSTWYFVVGVGDRVNGYRLYVNGVQESTTRINALSDQDGTLTNTANLTVGANLNSKVHTKGRFDDVRVYNRALTPAEISALYAEGKEPDPAPVQNKPNIVVIFTDDQDAPSLSFMPKVKSLLQDKGITFSNSFVEFPVCCPSRSTFMTGQNATNHGVLGNEIETQGGYGVFQKTEGNTLPVWLKSAGYTTAMIGKYLNGYPETSPIVPPGWDTWKVLVRPTWYYNYGLNENGVVTTYGETAADYQTDVLARKAAEYIASKKDSSQPFFLWLTPASPHIVQTSFKGQNPEPAPRHAGTFGNLALPQWVSLNEADMSDKPLFMQQHPLADLAFATRLYRDQRESLLSVDDMVETVVNALSAAGKLDNTVIVFTSDNGYSHGQHRRNNNKYLAYEESLRTPLVIRGPGIAANQTRSEMVTNLDIVATIIDTAKATPGRSLDGRSLAPLYTGSAPWRTAFFFEGNDQSGTNSREFFGRYAAVRTLSAKYVLHQTGEEELYDLTKDPNEMQSTHADPAYAGLKATLSGVLRSLRTCTGTSCWYTSPILGGSGSFGASSPGGAQQSVAPVGTVPGTSIACPNITRTLVRGTRGSDVTALQTYLIAAGYLDAGNATGFFGRLTEAAVQKFQCAKSIACSGTPSTTGYGAVGPKTRAALLNCAR